MPCALRALATVVTGVTISVTGSLRLTDIVNWQAQNTWLILLQPLGFLMFFIAASAELNRTRFEAALADVYQHNLAVAAVDDGTVGDRQFRVWAAGVDFGLGIHVGLEQQMRVRKLDAHANRASGRIEMRINQRDRAGKSTVRIAAHTDRDRLAFVDSRQIALGDIYKCPDNGMISDAKQHVTRHRAHALDDISL